MKSGLKYYIRIYLMIISQDFKSKMQFRTDFLISNVGMVTFNISGLVSFWILFKSIPDIQGWNYNEMVFLYAFFIMSISPAQLFFENLWGTGSKVLSGDFIKYCFRPLNLFFYYVSEVFDVKGLGQMAFGVAALVYAWSNLHIPVTALNILLLVLNLAGASLIMVGIMVLASSSAFWIINSLSVVTFVFRFKEYAKYPITIFNGAFRFIFTFLIPIGFIAFYPSQIFLRPDNITVMALLSPIIGGAFFAVSYAIWMVGARGYSGTGS